MAKSDDRPKWTHSLSEEDVQWLSSGITQISHHWEMTGADTSENWICLHKSDGNARRFPSAFLNSNGYFEFKPNWRELVVATHRGEQAIKDLGAIRAWEAKHRRERAEYERLKRKFEPT